MIFLSENVPWVLSKTIRHKENNSFNKKKEDDNLKQPSLKITTISYVHDPDAAKKWFELYRDILMDQLMDKKQEEDSYNGLNE